MRVLHTELKGIKCLHLLRRTDPQVEDTFNYQNEKGTADITVEGYLT